MSLDDNDFLVKIQARISTMAVCWRKKLLHEFEKWCVILASVGGVFA